jgi:hypothetical protein
MTLSFLTPTHATAAWCVQVAKLLRERDRVMGSLQELQAAFKVHELRHNSVVGEVQARVAEKESQIAELQSRLAAAQQQLAEQQAAAKSRADAAPHRAPQKEGAAVQLPRTINRALPFDERPADKVI